MKILRKLSPLVAILASTSAVLFLLAAPVGAQPNEYFVDWSTTRNCGGNTPCYTTIQAAVTAAAAPAIIYVYPGSYDEGVNLSNMTPDGDLTLMTVGANGIPTPGTVTVDYQSPAYGEFYTTSPFDGDVTIDGFNLHSMQPAIEVETSGTNDVVIRNVTATDVQDEEGIYVKAGGDVTIVNCVTSNNGEDGIEVYDTGGDVTISNCTANGNGERGILVQNVSGKVTITDCTVNDNGVSGIDGLDVEQARGGVTIRDCTATGNGGVNIDVTTVIGDVTIQGSTANGSLLDHGIRVLEHGRGEVSILNCTANDNQASGIQAMGIGGRLEISNCTTNGNKGTGHAVGGISVGSAASTVSVTNCTADGNTRAGLFADSLGGPLYISSCVFTRNAVGVLFHELFEADEVLVNGSIICANSSAGLDTDTPEVDATGNWWGCPLGPGGLGCDIVVEPGPPTVDYDPWIDTVTVTAPTSVMAGESAPVAFQFSGSDGTVFLGEGPGDLHGAPTFIVGTDNGTVTGGGFINQLNGVMAVTLVPAFGGTATVWADGPCGLDAQVGLEAWEFVPEPGSALLLASGLMGLAGYAGLRLRKR